MWLQVSVYQMLRASQLLFTALYSVAFLRRTLGQWQLSGIAANVAGWAPSAGHAVPGLLNQGRRMRMCPSGLPFFKEQVSRPCWLCCIRVASTRRAFHVQRPAVLTCLPGCLQASAWWGWLAF